MLPAYLPATSAPATGGPPSGARVKERIEEAQRWLLFMRHCSNCTAGDGQTCEHGDRCKSGRALYRHMSTCQAGSGCSYPKCALVKAILKHHQKCTRINCQICMPVKAYVHSKPSVPASHGAAPAAGHGSSSGPSTYAGAAAPHAAAMPRYPQPGSQAGLPAAAGYGVQPSMLNQYPSGLPMAPGIEGMPGGPQGPGHAAALASQAFKLAHQQLDPATAAAAAAAAAAGPGMAHPLPQGLAPPPGADPAATQAWLLQLYVQACSYQDDTQCGEMSPQLLQLQQMMQQQQGQQGRTPRHSVDMGLIARSLQQQQPMQQASQQQQQQQPHQAQQQQRQQQQQPQQSRQPAPPQQQPLPPSQPHPLQVQHQQQLQQQQQQQRQQDPRAAAGTTPAAPAGPTQSGSPSGSAQVPSTPQPRGHWAGDGSGVRGVGVAGLLDPPSPGVRDPRLAPQQTSPAKPTATAPPALPPPALVTHTVPAPAAVAAAAAPAGPNTVPTSALPSWPELPMPDASRRSRPGSTTSDNDALMSEGQLADDVHMSTAPDNVVAGVATTSGSPSTCTVAPEDLDGDDDGKAPPTRAVSVNMGSPPQSPAREQIAQPWAMSAEVSPGDHAIPPAASSAPGSATAVGGTAAAAAAAAVRSLSPPQQAEQAAELLLTLRHSG